MGPQTTATMQTALRILNAINEHRPPEQSDVEELRLAAPFQEDIPADELACEFVQMILHLPSVRERRERLHSTTVPRPETIRY